MTTFCSLHILCSIKSLSFSSNATFLISWLFDEGCWSYVYVSQMSKPECSKTFKKSLESASARFTNISCIGSKSISDIVWQLKSKSSSRGSSVGNLRSFKVRQLWWICLITCFVWLFRSKESVSESGFLSLSLSTSWTTELTEVELNTSCPQVTLNLCRT